MHLFCIASSMKKKILFFFLPIFLESIKWCQMLSTTYRYPDFFLSHLLSWMEEKRIIICILRTSHAGGSDDSKKKLDEGERDRCLCCCCCCCCCFLLNFQMTNEVGDAIIRTYPTDNRLLINFRLSSSAEILLTSTDGACKSAPNGRKRVCNVYIFRLSFHFACHRWWLGSCHI